MVLIKGSAFVQFSSQFFQVAIPPLFMVVPVILSRKYIQWQNLIQSMSHRGVEKLKEWILGQIFWTSFSNCSKITSSTFSFNFYFQATFYTYGLVFFNFVSSSPWSLTLSCNRLNESGWTVLFGFSPGSNLWIPCLTWSRSERRLSNRDRT